MRKTARLLKMTRQEAIRLLDLPIDTRVFDPKVLKSSYTKMAKRYHPDAPNGDEEKFKEIREAFEVLSSSSPFGTGTGSDGKPSYRSTYKFDDSDSNARWAQMKARFISINQSYNHNYI